MKFENDSFPLSVRRRQMLLLPLALAGCAEPYVVGSGTRPPSGAQPAQQRIATLDVEGDVEVQQSGRRFRGQDGNALFRGDEVRTFSNSYASISFLDGDRVWLDYDTRVRMGSLFTFFGRVFASVSGVFQVDSEFVAASSEGTEYTVSIGRGARDAFSVAVRSGVVRCTPRRGGWGVIRLSAGQRLRAVGAAQPTIDPLDGREAQEEFGWVGRVSRTPVIPRQPYTPPQSPSGTRQPPATQPPTEPTTQPPVTRPPVTQPPTTQPGTTVPPVTRPPQRTAPVYKQPSEPIVR